MRKKLKPQLLEQSGLRYQQIILGNIDMTSIAILEAVNTTAVQFHGQPIITTMVAGIAYVAMRPIVEGIGVDWSGQMAKLKTQRDKYGCRDISTPSKGGIQQMLCIPLRKLNGWLFSINPEKVRADIRDKLIQYQEECFAVLYEYWNKGAAVNQRKAKTTVDERTPLRDAVNMLVGKKGLRYDDAYNMVHQRFAIDSIDELELTQIPLAVEYIHRVVLDGEYIGKQMELPVPALTLDYGMTFFDKYLWIIGKDSVNSPARYPAGMLLPNGDYPNPCGRLLVELRNAGFSIDAAEFQLKSLQHHLEVHRHRLDRIHRAVINS